MKHIVREGASNVIAAALISGGRTAHSRFKLSFDLSKREEANCIVSYGAIKGKLLDEYGLIIWNETTMSHKVSFEAHDMVLRHLRHKTRLMGISTVLIA